jgi:thiamine-monophosphate kinase
MSWNESEIIDFIVKSGLNHVGDDAAMLEIAGSRIAVCADAVIEGVHFDSSYFPPYLVGKKAVVVNLSDLAAFGARPKFITATVAAPKQYELTELLRGIIEAARAYEVELVGGDLSTSCTHVAVSVTAIGTLFGSKPLLRSGAQPGDSIFVTGPVGASAAGLKMLQAGLAGPEDWIKAHLEPKPRIAQSEALCAIGATAAIDISDGFALDLHRLADASGVGFTISNVPGAQGVDLDSALAGGEDYELLFTHPSPGAVTSAFHQANLALPIRVGEIVKDSATRSIGNKPLPRNGYLH